jgi:hypothetical protein
MAARLLGRGGHFGHAASFPDEELLRNALLGSIGRRMRLFRRPPKRYEQSFPR